MRRKLYLTILGLTIVHLCLLWLYLWSRNGSETKVRLTIENDQYSFFLDNHLITRYRLKTPWKDGQIGYFQYKKTVPIIPQNQTLKTITITDSDTGQVVLSTDFSNINFPNKEWEINKKIWQFNREGLTSGAKHGFLFSKSSWHNVILDAAVLNLNAAKFFLRVKNRYSYVGLFMRPFRDFDSRFFLMKHKKKISESDNKTTYLSPKETFKRTINLILNFYPYFLGIIILLIFTIFTFNGIIRLIQVTRRKSKSANTDELNLSRKNKKSFVEKNSSEQTEAINEKIKKEKSDSEQSISVIYTTPQEIEVIQKKTVFSVKIKILFVIAAIVLSILSFFWIHYVTMNYLEGIPHVQDSAVYVFQSKYMAMGKISIPIPAYPSFFTLKGFIKVKNGKMFGQYPFGYPLFLSLGAFLGNISIIPALSGALLLFFVFLCGRYLISDVWGILAMIMLFCSPFFQMTAPNFMAHTTAALYLIISFYAFIQIENGKSNVILPLLGGFFLGLLFNTRPMTAIAVGICYGIYILVVQFSTKMKKRFFLRSSFFAIGFLFPFALFFLYNYILMGNALDFPYGATAAKVTSVKFDYHRISKAFLDNFTLTSLFLMVVFGWNSFKTTIFLYGNTIAEKVYRKPILLMLGAIISVFFAYMFYSISSVTVMYGPRYVFEITPFFILLTVIGAKNFATFAGRFQKICTSTFCKKQPHYQKNNEILKIDRENNQKIEKSDALIEANKNRIGNGKFLELSGSVIVFLFLLSFSVIVFGYWLSAKSRPWIGNVYVPQNIHDLKGFNHVYPIVQNIVKKQKISDAIIFVTTDKKNKSQWWYYGSVFFENSPLFDNDIIYAKDLGKKKNNELMKLYPKKRYYKIHYRLGTISEIAPINQKINKPQ